MIKGLAELLTVKPAAKSFGLAARFTVPISIIILSLAASILNKPFSLCFYMAALIFTGALLAYSSGLSKLFKGLQLILIFIALGAFINLASIIAGLTPLGIEKVLTGAVRLSTIAFSAILLIQWVKVEEWMYVLSKAGLENVARVLTLSIIQIPLTLSAFSEALLSIKLKYGGRYVTRVLNPLIIHAFYTARNVSESLLIYGYPMPVKPVIYRRGDIVLLAILVGLMLILLY